MSEDHPILSNTGSDNQQSYNAYEGVSGSITFTEPRQEKPPWYRRAFIDRFYSKCWKSICFWSYIFSWLAILALLTV